MQISLRRKLSLSYVLVALLCVILISIMANFFLEKQFKNYVIETHERVNQNIVNSLVQLYNNNGWDKDVVQNIGINALGNGIILIVKDPWGNTIWNAASYNKGMCQSMLIHMSKNMMKLYPHWKGSYKQDEYPLIKNHQKVGTAIMGYYGPFYYSDVDIGFLNTLNTILVSVGIISLSLALILGVIMAGGLIRPILRVIEIAKKISKGDYSTRSDENSNIIEINSLIYTINNLAQTLQNQENLRKRLTADVSHELRTPLTTLQSHMEAILDGIWEPTQDRINSCHEEIMRINRMVSDLERLAEYEGDNLILTKSQFNISEVIKNIMLNFQNEYVSKKIDFVFHSKDIFIYADKDKINQIIINLISNALKYTKQGGKVLLEVDNKKGYLQLIVKDNGKGISKEDLPYIFERFYRADKSRNRLTGGAGIGLTITKSLVEAHKGKIIVESELNKGTTFKISIPIK